ncbi:RNase P modulator RnpM [Oceanirhabdus sp. W0125-5]|uniref:RNase P modulator RnpM n=1 Tax=Oceanirhabdus sp. W0125-5 TaxID=2999116 RepID=UPI0022F2C3B6|nr:YlxR family protein [Oceanirhabdus sp. W0125-5]WBW94832.1 YlxR family protein [Oceanirhabdus sp. W0125-5]
MKTRKISQRMCIGCGEMKPKKELIRIVKNKEGEVSIDKVGKKPGRGAYVCNSIECLEKGIKSRRVERSFKMKIDQEIYDKLKEEIINE